MGSEIFSGLAHFIKGSVFFWFGIVSLGRWAGCFAEIGWVSRLGIMYLRFSDVLVGMEHDNTKERP